MDKISEMVKTLITRWTAESPETYKKITDIALITGIVSSIILLMPTLVPAIILPAWVIPLSALFIAISSKLTTK
jgi:hypothetical protein